MSKDHHDQPLKRGYAKSYKKQIGYHIGGNGKRKGKRFWLGRNVDFARTLVKHISAEWTIIKTAARADGRMPLWTPRRYSGSS